MNKQDFRQKLIKASATKHIVDRWLATKSDDYDFEPHSSTIEYNRFYLTQSDTFTLDPPAPKLNYSTNVYYEIHSTITHVNMMSFGYQFSTQYQAERQLLKQSSMLKRYHSPYIVKFTTRRLSQINEPTAKA